MGVTDAFLTKLNPLGSSLSYSTYLGGSWYDEGRCVAIDNANCVYVAGHTQSSNFPTLNPFQSTLASGGEWDVFVTKFNSTGSGLLYSTYIGGSDRDQCYGLRLDNDGCAYITGFTLSINYPTTSGAFQPTLIWSRDAFITRLSPSGSTLFYSTYFGNNGIDEGRSIAVDSDKCAYITGYTTSTSFYTTTGAFQTINQGGAWGWDGFISKMCIGSLPIEQILIQANYTKNTVQITWQNSVVEPIKYFVIEKWQNNTWQGIGEVSSGVNIYEDREGIYTGSTLMYRIRAVNKDGRSYYSDIATVTVPELDKNFGLYPNPAQNYVVVENYTNTVQEYELSDISGKILQVYTLPQGKNSIEISLPKGMYFIRERREGKTERLAVE